MINRIYLISQMYPYIAGEETFIEPELEAFRKYTDYEITILTHTVLTDECMFCPLEDSKIVPYNGLLKYGVKPLLWLIMAFFSDIGLHEIIQIMKTKQKVFSRIVESCQYFIRAEAFAEELKKMDLDMSDSIMYTYWFDYHTLALLMHKKQMGFNRVISRIHGYDLYDERRTGNRQPFRWYMDAQIDKLYFIAQNGIEYYGNRYSVDISSEKYKLSRLGVKGVGGLKPAFGDINDITQEHIIVSCATVVELKRIDIIVRALSMIDDINIRWIHFGDGDMYSNISNLAEEMLQHKDNIVYDLPGWCAIDDIMQYYKNNNITVFITTSATEGCPISIQEAMACGIPIIATDVGEIRHMIDGNGILLSENPSDSEVRDSIYKILTLDSETREMYRNKSYELWSIMFDADNNFRKFVDDVKELRDVL